ncbi:MAG: metalloregulator ArsR/SmtB family transcription factor [Bacteroidota bacterium]|jgi:DNA-binding transcriptional ArsR family regulator
MKLDVQKVEFAAKKIRTITHPARVQIIKLLEENEKLNVTQIYEKLNILQAETSHHLALLREYGILKKVRQGKMSIYSLNTETLENIIKISEDLSKR